PPPACNRCPPARPQVAEGRPTPPPSAPALRRLPAGSRLWRRPPQPRIRHPRHGRRAARGGGGGHHTLLRDRRPRRPRLPAGDVRYSALHGDRRHRGVAARAAEDLRAGGPVEGGSGVSLVIASLGELRPGETKKFL